MGLVIKMEMERRVFFMNRRHRIVCRPLSTNREGN